MATAFFRGRPQNRQNIVENGAYTMDFRSMETNCITLTQEESLLYINITQKR